MTTPATPAYVTLATAAAEAGDHTARLWGELESAERLAASSWSGVHRAAQAAGDHATADQALATARAHWTRADAIGALWQKHSGRPRPAR